MGVLPYSWPSRTLDIPGRHFLLLGLVFGLSLGLSSTSLLNRYGKRKRDESTEPHDIPPRPIEVRTDEIVNGVPGLIGNTHLVRISSLSDALGVEILGKAEFLNPGGSVKDRVALKIIEDAECDGLLHPHTGSRIFEGTVGSTAIIMPDDVAEEKVKALQALGAEVERRYLHHLTQISSLLCALLSHLTRLCSILTKAEKNLAKQRARDFGRTDIVETLKSSIATTFDTSSSTTSAVVVTSTANESEVKQASDALESRPRGFFADQFENRSNFKAHYEGTGPEIWRQTNGNIVAFVSGAGTGGTIAGTGKYLKDMDDNVLVVLSDPEGSGLYNKIKYGVMYDAREKEGTKRRHQVDTVVEGIGLNRLTNNFDLAIPIIDDAFRITDAEAVAMSRYVMLNDGFFLGSSSACNLFACVKLAKKMKWSKGERIVTILCDSGSRHYSKFWYVRACLVHEDDAHHHTIHRNDDYLHKAGIPIDTTIVQNALKA
ncbi:CYS12 [Sanghuangporus sanghuang]